MSYVGTSNLPNGLLLWLVFLGLAAVVVVVATLVWRLGELLVHRLNRSSKGVS